MRAFHFAWLSLFAAFLGWFCIPPLMPTIARELNLSKQDTANSNILGVASTILGRIIIGPLCDSFGPRRVQSILLICGAIPVALAATVTTASGLLTARFFIGFVGSAFVCTQTWVSDMFVKDIVGTANGVVAGWGNLGGGVTFLVIPLIFAMFNSSDFISSDAAWRLSMGFPALCLVVVGLMIHFASDDTPRGKKHAIQTSCQIRSTLRALSDPSTAILSIQYACCFGVELQLNSILGLYFYEEFTQEDCDPTRDVEKCRILSQSTAGVMASLFGLMNIFARALGGFVSDKCNQKYQMKGRIGVQMTSLFFQGIFLMIFSQMKTLFSAGFALICFSLFVQAAEGATFAIVPYIWPQYTGSISGMVGAGGNVGAVCWGFLFKALATPQEGFLYLSFIVTAASFLTPILLWTFKRDFS